MGFDIYTFAVNLIQSNPRVANNPLAQQYLEVIRNRDSKRGIEIARNICEMNGEPVEQAVQRAQNSIFGITNKNNGG